MPPASPATHVTHTSPFSENPTTCVTPPPSTSENTGPGMYPQEEKTLPKPHRADVYGEAEHDADGHADRVYDGQGGQVEYDPDGLPARERQ